MSQKVKKYSKAAMEVALQVIKSGGMSLCQAAKAFNIPKQTLSDRKNQISNSDAIGKPTKLTKNEENELENWIFKRADNGYPVNIASLKKKAEEILEVRLGKKSSTLHVSWPYRFLKRHPEISKRKPSKVSRSSANVSEKDLRAWHQQVTKFFIEKDLLLQIDRLPDTIINVDETGFQLVPTNNKVLGKKGANAIFEVTNGVEKAFVTVMFAITASGKLLPPMMLFKPMSEAKRHAIMDKIPNNWGVAENPSGYMTGVAMRKYLEWLTNGPLKDIGEKKIIFLDNHGSHKTKEVRNFSRSNGIELIGIYPNSTRIIQPLDIKVFLPIKTCFRSKMQDWSIEHPGETFDTSQLAPMINEACQEALSEDLIKKSFKDAGLHPWNVENIDFTKCLGGQPQQTEPVGVLQVPAMSPNTQSLRERLNFHLEQAKLIQQQIQNNNLSASIADESLSNSSDVTLLASSDRSLDEILALPAKPKRLGKKSTVKLPFVFTSDSYKAIMDAKEREVDDLLHKQQERRIRIAEKKAVNAEKKRQVAEKKEAKALTQSNKENGKKKKLPTSFHRDMFGPDASQLTFVQPLRAHNLTQEPPVPKVRLPRNTSSYTGCDDDLKELHHLLQKSRRNPEVMFKRRKELKDHEFKDCKDISNVHLETYVAMFQTKIADFLTRKQQTKRLDPVQMTTGDILSDTQILFVLQKIEDLRPFDERGTKQEVLMDIILPEFIMFLFCEKFGLSDEKASEILKLQEEVLILNVEDNEPQAASTPISTKKKASKPGRPKKINFSSHEQNDIEALKIPASRIKRKQEIDASKDVVAQKVAAHNSRQLRSRSYIGRC